MSDLGKGPATAMFFQPTSRRQRRPQLQISERRLLLMFGDVLAVMLSVLFALRIWAWVARTAFRPEFVLRNGYLFVVLIALWLFLASVNDLYVLQVAASRTQTLRRLILVNLQLFFVYVLIFFLSPRDALPRLFVLYYAVLSIVIIAAWRFTRPALMGWASEPRRTLIVGGNAAAAALVQAIREHAARDYELKGIIGTSESLGQTIEDIPVVGIHSDLMNFVARDRITELVITSTRDLTGELYLSVMDAYERGIKVLPMTLLYERMTGRVPVMHIQDDWPIVLLADQDDHPMVEVDRILKRLIDIVLSLIGMIGFLLILPVIALLIRLDSQGTIFYSQDRVGLNGRIFRIYKFRSMVTDAEADTGAVFSKPGDPRITRVGGFMRKTRLDELPQFINVLRGEMSLIGPRPERPEHVARLSEKIPFYRTRLIVRPGLSGWAQVKYNYGANDEDALVKLEYDLYYIRHQSLLLDMNIIVRTIGKALLFKGV